MRSGRGLGALGRARISVAARLAVGFVASLSVLGGCTAATQNVRAYRAYAHEEVSLKVAFDRVEDMARTLELVDRILSQTSYTPNDVWVRRLPMTDAEFRVMKEEIKHENPYKFGDFEVPILKVYRRHCERVLQEYAPPPEKAMYPSLLDAVAGLIPRTPAIKAHWTAYRQATEAHSDALEEEKRLEEELAGKDDATQKARANELAQKRQKTAAAAGAVDAAKGELQRDAALIESDAKLTTADKQQIARDALGVLSVAFRIELEAVALAPIVAIQLVRALPGAPREMVAKPSLKIVRQAWQMPTYIAGIRERFTRQLVVLEGLTKTLATALHTSVEDSPGFALHESVVDQIVGITLDSFRVDVKAGGEAFIFSSIATGAQQSTQNQDNTQSETVDYRGRKFKLDYRIQPIILASARMDIVLDWIRMPGAAQLAFGYSTDRVFKSGGTIETTSLSQALGIKSGFSDVFDVALGFLGVRSGVRISRFTGGELRQVDATDVTRVLAKAPLQLTMTHIDVGYDILFAVGDAGMKAWMEELVVGVRYFRYELPRILYELRNVSTDPNRKAFIFNRESPIQQVESQYYMAGFSARFGVGEAPRVSPFADLALYGGAGPSAFYFLRDQNLGDIPENRELSKEVAWVVNGGLGAGLRWRLFPRGWRIRAELRGYYRADFIYTRINRSNTSSGEERRTDFGSVDVFHGPSAAFRMAF